MQNDYWGIFAELHAAGTESVGLYEEPLASWYDALMPLQEDIPDYLALAERNPGHVLEIGCGNGRVLLRMAEAGVEVVGIDDSVDQLKLIRTRIATLPAHVRERIHLVQGDATRTSLGRQFRLIILPACSIVLFREPPQLAKLLGMVREHLAPDGIFAFDVLDYDWTAVANWDGKVVSVQYPTDEGTLHFWMGAKTSLNRTCITTNTYWQIPSASGAIRCCLQSRRTKIFSQSDLEGVLWRAGLQIRDRLVRSQQGEMAERHLICCTARTDHPYPLWHPFQPHKDDAPNVMIFHEGEGLTIRTRNGASYLDFAGSLWSNQCGLGHPQIIAAIAEQLKRLSSGPLFTGRGNEAALALATELVRIAPSPLPWVFLVGSGSEAVEVAIKIARHHQRLAGRPDCTEIVYLDASYHGTFFGSMSVSGLHDGWERVGPILSGTWPIRTPAHDSMSDELSREAAIACAAEFERLVLSRDEAIAAFIVEPILGSAGVVVPSRAYFESIQSICGKYEIVLIVDEVATGMGRTGNWFASERFGLKPDILLVAKGLTSGYLPLGAVLFSSEIGARQVAAGECIWHGSSQNGNPACCAAALETIRVIRDECLLDRATSTGAYFAKRLAELLDYPAVREVRAAGLMLALELTQVDGSKCTPLQVAKIYAALKSAGILTHPESSCLVFMPSLLVSRLEIDQAIECLHGVLSNIRLLAGDIILTGR